MPSSAISASESLHRAPSPVLVGPSSSPLLLSPAVAHQLLEDFKGLVRRDVAVPVAAMHALVSVIRASDATTWMQLEQELRETILTLKRLRSSDLGGRTMLSLGSGCDLFMKYVSRAFLEFPDFEECKQELARRGENLAGMSLSSRHSIAEHGSPFVRDGCTVLFHGSSRVVVTLLLLAAKTKQFNVLVTESRPNNEGEEVARIFERAGVPARVVLDCGVGPAMESADMCIVGAEGVMENGGIVNKIGTYQIAMIAKMLRKPFYVAVESYKFARMYPLSQRDAVEMVRDMSVPPTATSAGSGVGAVGSSSPERHHRHGHTHRSGSGSGADLERSYHHSPLAAPQPQAEEQPTIDFTPAEYITLLFTDLGVLTPSAVSDELIRLYQ